MEGSSEPLLDAKAEVSPVLEGAGAAGFWSRKDHSLNCVFLLPFQVANQVSEWQPRPVLSRPPLGEGRAAGALRLASGEAAEGRRPEPPSAVPRVQGLCPWAGDFHPTTLIAPSTLHLRW